MFRPVAPGLVPDIHDDGLVVLGVPDDLIQEAHAQGPRPDNQVVGGKLRHRETNLLSPFDCTLTDVGSRTELKYCGY